MQQHVERIYDLVFISLFNTILGALRAREWEEEERKQREGKRERLEENERREREREREFHLHTCFYEEKQQSRCSVKTLRLKFAVAAWFIYYL